jgi:hypothetical protein
MSLFSMGAVVPIEPNTGAPIGLPWMADECDSTPQRSYGVAAFPIQAGFGVVTDAILRNPAVVPVQFTLSDTPTLGHPVALGFHGRCDKLARDFQVIEDMATPVRVWVKGYAPLKPYAISDVQISKVPGKRALILSCTFVRLNFATLLMVPPAVSPDLLALGIVPF